MALAVHPDINEIMRLGGLLYWNPAALDAEANYGAKIGYIKGMKLSPQYATVPLREVYHGEEVIDVLYVGDSASITVLVRNYNATTLGLLFPGLNATLAVKSPGAIAPGTLMKSSYKGRLLFVPEDTTNQLCLIFQYCIPHIAETAKIAMSHKDESQFPCVFQVIRKTDDADGKYYLGPISGAVLR